MSYILESLRKSDKERQTGTTESTFFIPTEIASVNTPTFFSIRRLTMILLVTIISLMAAWYFIDREDAKVHSSAIDLATSFPKKEPVLLLVEPEPVRTLPDPEIKQSVVSSSTDNVTDTLYSQAESITDEKVTSLYQLKNKNDGPAEPLADDPAATKNKAEVSTSIVGSQELVVKKIPTIYELDRLMQKSIPAIDYGAHIYATDNISGFVILNGAKRKMGEKLRNGVYIERVNKEEVILSYRGLIFSLPAMNNWVP